jgi:hypothetical protein
MAGKSPGRARATDLSRSTSILAIFCICNASVAATLLLLLLPAACRMARLQMSWSGWQQQGGS